MSAAELKIQIDSILDDIADTVNMANNVEGKLNDVQGGIILIGLTNSNNDNVSGSLALAQGIKAINDGLLTALFNLRQRLTIYRDSL
jgi:CHASE2 domain-containing sensor protein